jgi:hypothetical protein
MSSSTDSDEILSDDDTIIANPHFTRQKSVLVKQESDGHPEAQVEPIETNSAPV